MPPYLAFQLKIVASDMLCRRARARLHVGLCLLQHTGDLLFRKPLAFDLVRPRLGRTSNRNCRKLPVAGQWGGPTIPRRSSTFFRGSGDHTYIITASRIIWGEKLKYRDGLAGLRGRGIGNT